MGLNELCRPWPKQRAEKPWAALGISFCGTTAEIESLHTETWICLMRWTLVSELVLQSNPTSQF